VHAIASDERHLFRILALRPELPALELILLDSAAPSERRTAALLVDAAIAVGAAGLADDPDVLRKAAAGDEGVAFLRVDADGACRPIARTRLLTLTEAIARSVGIGRETTVFAALPVGSPERLGASLAALSRGATLLLHDPAERPDAGLREHPPDAILLDVEGLRRLHRAWLEDIEAKPRLGRAVAGWALRQGHEAQKDGWKRRLAEKLALTGLREKLGGRTTRLDLIGAAPKSAPAEIEAFFQAVGLSLQYPTADKVS
jgi:hypothetical protein